MDRKTLIKKLRRIFSDSYKQDKKYGEVWLSYIDFGGLYFTDEFYVLNVKTETRINYTEVISSVLHMLDDKAKEELKRIWTVSVHQPNERAYCDTGDFMVYSKPGLG
ncbi:MAG: hypothetical protein WCF67_06180 [Chitinophagaceae bacterium]